MKKHVILSVGLASVLLLAACSDKEETDKELNVKTEEVKNKVEDNKEDKNKVNEIVGYDISDDEIAKINDEILKVASDESLETEDLIKKIKLLEDKKIEKSSLSNPSKVGDTFNTSLVTVTNDLKIDPAQFEISFSEVLKGQEAVDFLTKDGTDYFYKLEDGEEVNVFKLNFKYLNSEKELPYLLNNRNFITYYKDGTYLGEPMYLNKSFDGEMKKGDEETMYVFTRSKKGEEVIISLFGEERDYHFSNK